MNLRQELVGAFGDPIDENPTGVMMEPAFAAAGLQWRYQLLHVPRQDLAAAVAAVRVLGKLGNPGSVGLLIAALGDRREIVRLEASWALKRITGEDFGTAQERWKLWWNSRRKTAPANP